MALYAIGDLHLSLGSDKPMDVFGGDWHDYVKKITDGFSGLDPDDMCILCGDTSWGASLEESLDDFLFIDKLPGKKILLKGNHDYWWTTATKMKSFFAANGISTIDILNNNCFFYDDAAICGTRGWMMEPETFTPHNEKITAREAGRLRASLQAAGNSPVRLCFLHYPPRYRELVGKEIIAVMHEYNVKNCWYGHLHGRSLQIAVSGEIDGVMYEIVSADAINFKPLLVYE